MNSRDFKLPKLSTIWAFLTDGMEGVAVLVVEQFNKQVLSKVKSPEELKPYIADLQAIIVCVRAILQNHSSKFSDAKKKAWDALLVLLENLAKAFDDMKLSQEEFNQLLDDIRATIKAFKEAK